MDIFELLFFIVCLILLVYILYYLFIEIFVKRILSKVFGLKKNEVTLNYRYRPQSYYKTNNSGTKDSTNYMRRTISETYKIENNQINDKSIALTNQNISFGNNTNYELKNFMTPSEYEFYVKMRPLLGKYRIIPQINLATFINKKKKNDKHNYQNELFHNIDFAIFSYDYKKLLLLIELNDRSHSKPNRIDRDKKVKSICNDAGIILLTFYTKFPNTQEFILNRIYKYIQR